MPSSRSAPTFARINTTTIPATIPSPISARSIPKRFHRAAASPTRALRSDYSYVKGIHNIKAGITYQQTFLNENDSFGIIDPTVLPATLDAAGNPCFNTVTGMAVPGTPCATLLPIDLTRGGNLFNFRGSTDVKELSMYVQDTITKGAWSFNLGIRGDIYNGLSSASQAEPRVGIAYNIKPTNTVLRVSYARTLETPFNENLDHRDDRLQCAGDRRADSLRAREFAGRLSQ